jgi:hypothetical protein
VSTKERFEKRLTELIKAKVPRPPTAEAIFKEDSSVAYYRGYTKGVADALDAVSETLKEMKP